MTLKALYMWAQTRRFSADYAGCGLYGYGG
jgi:hypothetical protein